ncbi:MAG TPA: ABC transporter permease subunit [Hyphomonadaceae bacterium]|nr:ABC transporter permease subunit [Hyphomonadaceae bacterium]HPN06755.1 ABC transporter permease subunit [Hyphomonadaceae bacterium]
MNENLALNMRQAGNALRAVYIRELAAYFLTPLAYVFIAIFLIALGSFTFEIGHFFDTNQADLAPFFLFHPWLYLVFLPAIAMRLWADEARGGTLELLLTLPAPTWSLVLGKFLAAWTVAAAALLLTTPMWMSVNWLGAPDNTAIFLTYVISFLMAGGYLAIACAMSAAAGNQVVAFVLSVAVGFVFTAAGLPVVASAFGPGLAETMASFSLLTHFEAAQRGVLEMRALVFYIGFIAVWLAFNAIWVSARKGG